MHDDESQLRVPPSFVALHVEPGRTRPNAARDEIAARHELCEDLAQHLVEPARALLLGHGIAEDEVLARCLRGLSDSESGLDSREASWTIRRLAELLGWNCTGLFPDA